MKLRRLLPLIGLILWEELSLLVFVFFCAFVFYFGHDFDVALRVFINFGLLGQVFILIYNRKVIISHINYARGKKDAIK